MPDENAELYLPLSEPTLERVLDDRRTLAHAFEALSTHEIAASLRLRALSKPGGRADRAPERALAELLESCELATLEGGASTLRAHVLSTLDRGALASGYRRLPERGIALLDEESVAERGFLTSDGRWDLGFTIRHRAALAARSVTLEHARGDGATVERSERREDVAPDAIGRTRPDASSIRRGGAPTTLSVEQSRIYRELEAQDDEHLHVQGYAGTGKSSLIRAMVDLLAPRGARILVLAEHRRQLDATPLETGGRTGVDKATFAALAGRIIPPDLTSPAYLNLLRTGRSRAEMPDEELARRLGVRASGAFSAPEIARAARATVFVFCRGDDAEIAERHLPRTHRLAFGAATRTVTCAHARTLWEAIVSRPSRELAPLIRAYHLIKWVSLNRWPIPEKYTHVVIDESHYLPGAVRAILEASPQAAWTLGDDYQHLGGHATTWPSAPRTREMTRSLRTAREVEPLINPIIATHPSGTKARFHGNRMSRAEIVYYDAARARVPEARTVILVDDTWGLFEWAQRIAAAGGELELMGDRLALDRFVKDCIELHAHGSRGRHPELLRYASWSELAAHHHASAGFRRIDRLLERGYTYRDWRRTYARLSGGGERTHVLGLIGHTLNREFDDVMLAPDVLRDVGVRRRAAFAASMYVALTRARRRLIVPEGLRHWIEEISAPGPAAIERAPASPDEPVR